MCDALIANPSTEHFRRCKHFPVAKERRGKARLPKIDDAVLIFCTHIFSNGTKPPHSEIGRHSGHPLGQQTASGSLYNSFGYFMAVQRDVIAVIDDDPGMRTSLYNMLSSLGYRTELYASAQDFIDAALQSQAACLIVDVQLGDMSGIDLVRYLSKFGLAFPIIFMTGLEDRVVRRQAMAVGCVAYLHKPFALDYLINAITKAIRTNPHLT